MPDIGEMLCIVSAVAAAADALAASVCPDALAAAATADITDARVAC